MSIYFRPNNNNNRFNTLNLGQDADMSVCGVCLLIYLKQESE